MRTENALPVLRGILTDYQDVIAAPDVDRGLAAVAALEDVLRMITAGGKHGGSAENLARLAARALTRGDERL